MTSTAGHLIGPSGDSGNNTGHYHNAMADIHRELRRPAAQRNVFSLTQTTPTDLFRSKLSTSEIQSRAISSLPDDLLANIPDDSSSYSLFDGYQVSQEDREYRKSHRRRGSKSNKLLKDAESGGALTAGPEALKKERETLSRRLEMMGVRKNMCSSEIHEIDNKIANLHNSRKIVLDRLAGFEVDEVDLENERGWNIAFSFRSLPCSSYVGFDNSLTWICPTTVTEIDNKLEDIQEQSPETPTTAATPKSDEANESSFTSEDPAMDASFMSESIYQKLPSQSPKSLKHKSTSTFPRSNGNINGGFWDADNSSGKRSMPILHEHFEAGSPIMEIQAHSDMVTAIDFDYPFGTMVSAAMDDTVRVWDLHAGRSAGLLEGHHASVRCLQVEDNIVATGSMDASVKLWDLSRARPAARPNRTGKYEKEDDTDHASSTSSSSLEDCFVHSLEAHVDEVTALHFRGNTLISGSSDKTLRQWDLEKGRCVQTLDVLWAAAQASSLGGESWRPSGRLPDSSANFVGAVQCFDAALACGTADGMIRLWDLRSGHVHRSLVGHTGPVTCLQFDDVHLVTGSLDRSIRVCFFHLNSSRSSRVIY